MSFNRLLRYLNIAIILGVVAAGCGLYWFVWRPMPKSSGSFEVGVSAPVRVVRDDLGVPHIEASSEEDAYFAQGFATAQDRMWQMEGLRRMAAGEVAEIGGPAALEIDREARALGVRRLAESAEETLNAEERRYFAAYSRGVNAYLAEHRGKLPLEFTLARVTPRPWRITDSILIYYQLYRTLSSTWKRDLEKGAMLAAGNPEAVRRLLPVRSGGDVSAGSNAWVVSGKHTASGKPLLANDMHLELTIPGIWYQTHLRAPGLNVSGVTAPGLPGIVVGHNQRIAWGITNLEFDLQDVIRERGDGGSRVLRETVLVKGARNIELVNLVTARGPVVHADASGRYILRWTALDPGSFRYVTFAVNRAGDWQSFRDALRALPGPGLNFVYADVDGNIGLQVAGRLPLRNGFDGSVPLEGGSGWESYVPFDELPTSYNPPSGILVTANDDQFGSRPYPVSGHFSPPYRAHQIREALEKREGWKAEDMITLQKDVYSEFAVFFNQQLLAAYDRRKPTIPILGEAIPLLRKWNGQMELDLPQPLIVTLAYQHFRRALADVAAPGKEYRAMIATWVVERLLRERPDGWFDDYDDALLRELASALEEGERMQGREMAKWRYGRFNQLTLAHPIGSRLKWFARYFNIGPVEMSGAPTTIKQMTGRLGPSMRMAADPGDWERSLLNVVTGQSGHVLSSHYKDQWDAYYVGRSFPMQFGRVDADDTLELRPAR